MAGKFLVLTTVLLLLTGCREEQLSLPVAHAAGPDRTLASVQLASQETYEPAPRESCYAYMLRRPKHQRAIAVQARLRKADQLAAALHAQTVTVDLLGDHANILALEFPVVWPAVSAYSEKVSAVVEEYLNSPEVQDYLCNSGFAEVRLSARGLNDRRIHPIWKARITTMGLVKDASNRELDLP